MKYILLLSLLLLGCPPEQRPHMGPTDMADCASACEHIGPKQLNCDEGKPLEDGTSCQKFCESTLDAGHALNPSCVLHVTTCTQIETECTR